MADLEFEGHGGTALKCFECVYFGCGIKRLKSQQKSEIFTFSGKTRSDEGRQLCSVQA